MRSEKVKKLKVGKLKVGKLVGWTLKVVIWRLGLKCGMLNCENGEQWYAEIQQFEKNDVRQPWLSDQILSITLLQFKDEPSKGKL